MKAVIYLRVSTLDQKPENQKEACVTLARSRGYEDIEIFTEKRSAWKNEGQDRPQYQKIKKMANRGEINAVVVWSLDRWIRNMDMLLTDMKYFKLLNVKLHSVKDEWVESINIPGVFGEWMETMLTGLLGMLAQWESERRSDRVKEAVGEKINGVTHSYKGNKWGNKRIEEKHPGITQKVMLHHREGLSLRKIAEITGVAKSTVHGIIQSVRESSSENEGGSL